MKILISVIIPTYNRIQLLEKVLFALDKQDFPLNKYEVLVIDDGSIDQTKKIVKNLIKNLNLNLKYFYQQNNGPAKARNEGIKLSKGRFILFIGDDTIPHKSLISEHYSNLTKNPECGVLGSIKWSDEIKISNFMKFLSPNGPQFNFGAIKDPTNCGYMFYYTSNLSLNRTWFKSDLFDIDFKSAAMEDMELAYRLEKKGLKIIFNPGAIVYHYHPQNIMGFLIRQKDVVDGINLFLSKHPSEKDKFVPKFHSIKTNLFYLGQKCLRLLNLTNNKLFYKMIVQYNHFRLLGVILK